jgi:hypothetical protein
MERLGYRAGEIDRAFGLKRGCTANLIKEGAGPEAIEIPGESEPIVPVEKLHAWLGMLAQRHAEPS